jgi:predicted RNA-binding Zn-ribbon protein involved in translation (DUF1610 family)
MSVECATKTTNRKEKVMAGLIVFLIIAAVIAVVVLNQMKLNEVVECGSCGNKMTRGHFKKKGGCPKCGSDLIQRTGSQATKHQKGLE